MANSPSKVLYTVDDLIRDRASAEDPPPFLAYPRTGKSPGNYEVLSIAEVARLAYGAARHLSDHGFPPVQEETVISICGASDLNYIITVLGFCVLGYTTLLLSPRLSIEAYIKLMNDTVSQTLFYASSLQSTAEKVKLIRGAQLRIILSRQDYNAVDSTSFLPVVPSKPSDSLRKAFILHSSGSTNLPRPIHFTHGRLMAACAPALGYRAFLTVPFFHTHGLAVFFQTLYKRATLLLFDGNMPQTCDNLVQAIRGAQPEIVYTVPYVLKTLAESQDGIDELKACKLVSYSGSRCPDELGNRLTSEGVRLGSVFGSTEIAMVFSSLSRPDNDTAWNYLRPVAHAAPYIYMKAVDAGTYELVVLDGYPAKTMSNSDSPPNSYHSGDLFEPHPVLPDAWKFTGRRDDRVTMINGEKVLPVPIEDTIRQSPLVKEAVVFGNDRSACGVLLFRATADNRLSDETFLHKVWPYIEKANSQAEKYAQLSKDYVAIIPSSVDYPSTDKGSIQRAKIYTEFGSIIAALYTHPENRDTGTLVLTVPELEDWLRQTIRNQLDIPISGTEDSLFASGIDSLKAIHLKNLILSNLDVGESFSNINSMFVLEQDNIAALARNLYQRRLGNSQDKPSIVRQMEDTIRKYSEFPNIQPHDLEVPRSSSEYKIVLLTGATGGLGRYILCELLKIPSIDQIWCHVRAPSLEKATTRLKIILAPYKDILPENTWSRIIVFTGSLETRYYGLPTDQYQDLHSKLTHVIHAAYPVNFLLPFDSFIPQVAITYALLSLAMTSKSIHGAKFIFCSSISAVTSSAKTQHIVPSALIPISSEGSAVASTGYGQSKQVCESIIGNAIVYSRADALILRIGQIIPSLSSPSAPLWNPNEAIPLLIQSVRSTGRLPYRVQSSGDECSWLPVVTAARAILELADLAFPDKSSAPGTIQRHNLYNLLHPRPISWRRDVLPALRNAGLEFETVDFGSWLAALRASVQDPERNPSINLLSYWERQMDGDVENREKGTGGIENMKFDTSDAERDSAALQDAPDLIKERYIEAFLEEWQREWNKL